MNTFHKTLQLKIKFTYYCKLVKVRTLCILCNNWSLFVKIVPTPELAWCPFKHSLVKFPRPSKIDRFVHNDGDRESKLLSLSLWYYVLWSDVYLLRLKTLNNDSIVFIVFYTIMVQCSFEIVGFDLEVTFLLNWIFFWQLCQSSRPTLKKRQIRR